MTHVIRTPHGLLDLRALRSWNRANQRAIRENRGPEDLPKPTPTRFKCKCGRRTRSTDAICCHCRKEKS